MHVEKCGRKGHRAGRGPGKYFKLYFYLLENVSQLTGSSMQFANLMSLLISLVVSECTHQIEMAPDQTGAMTSTERITNPVHFCKQTCWSSLLTPFLSEVGEMIIYIHTKLEAGIQPFPPK
jgi:hypothetical protein